MESMDLSFEALTRETLELSNYLSQNGWDEQLSTTHQIDVREHFIQQVVEEISPRCSYPQAPGVVFRIDRGTDTFCLRGVACTSISDVFSALDNHDEALLRKLKIEEQFDDIRFFACESMERAEMIRDQLFNRRYPIEEDRICNISDPGFSWWMERGDKSFQIFYQSISVDRASTLIKLGPIGDGKVASRFFMYLENALASVIPMAHFSSEPRSFKLATQLVTPPFEQLFELFNSGLDICALPDFAFLKDHSTLYFYLSELSTLRKFWLSVEDDVGKRGPLWKQ